MQKLRPAAKVIATRVSKCGHNWECLVQQGEGERWIIFPLGQQETIKRIELRCTQYGLYYW